MSAVTEKFIDELVARVPSLQPVLREHLADNFGEVLPHVFFGDLTRHVMREHRNARGAGATSGAETGAASGNLLDALEDAFAAGNPEIGELIAVSFLGNLPSPGEDGADLREFLGPQLRSELSAQ